MQVVRTLPNSRSQTKQRRSHLWGADQQIISLLNLNGHSDLIIRDLTKHWMAMITWHLKYKASESLA
jgi:hypothetical protein